MSNKGVVLLAVPTMALVLSSCGVVHGTKARMTGRRDIMGAMANRDRIMKDMTPMRRARHKKQKQTAMLNDGRRLFSDPSLGKNGRTCESCHPGGTTTGKEAQVPMRDYGIPIPTLVGASARFPTYKIESDRVVTVSQMNNNCIRMFLDGRGLELSSREAIALCMYVSSLSNGESVQIGPHQFAREPALRIKER